MLPGDQTHGTEYCAPWFTRVCACQATKAFLEADEAKPGEEEEPDEFFVELEVRATSGMLPVINTRYCSNTLAHMSAQQPVWKRCMLT
jgi:hypothetical protein